VNCAPAFRAGTALIVLKGLRGFARNFFEQAPQPLRRRNPRSACSTAARTALRRTRCPVDDRDQVQIPAASDVGLCSKLPPWFARSIVLAAQKVKVCTSVPGMTLAVSAWADRPQTRASTSAADAAEGPTEIPLPQQRQHLEPAAAVATDGRVNIRVERFRARVPAADFPAEGRVSKSLLRAIPKEAQALPATRQPAPGAINPLRLSALGRWRADPAKK